MITHAEHCWGPASTRVPGWGTGIRKIGKELKDASEK